MKRPLISLLAWLGLAAVGLAADAEGPVVQLTKDGLSIIREATGKVATYKFSDDQKKGVYNKRRMWDYPHLAKHLGMGDMIWVVYEKQGQELVVTHIAIKRKANGGPIPPRPTAWDKELELPPWVLDWMAGKPLKPPKKK